MPGRARRVAHPSGGTACPRQTLQQHSTSRTEPSEFWPLSRGTSLPNNLPWGLKNGAFTSLMHCCLPGSSLLARPLRSSSFLLASLSPPNRTMGKVGGRENCTWWREWQDTLLGGDWWLRCVVAIGRLSRCGVEEVAAREACKVGMVLGEEREFKPGGP